MEKKLLRPDPTDYQIIACSNCLQIASCVCHLLACVWPELQDAAMALEIIADCFTMSVGGCMCVQIKKEIEAGPPVAAVPGGPPMAEVVPGSMTR